MKSTVIYTSDYCPYCVRAKQLLDRENIPYVEVNIQRDQQQRDALEKKSHIRTVPQIFVDDQFVSDCDGLYQLHRSGEFDKIFK